MEERKKIVLVDDQIVNLTIGRNALSDIYDVFTVPSGEKLLLLLNKITPDMILLDIEMPDMSGYEVIKILKANPETSGIPVFFLTAKSDAESELAGLSLGAIDYIYKPFSPPLLLKRIEVHLLVERQKKELENYNNNLEKMVQEKTKTVTELKNAVINTVAEVVESRDGVTGAHIERTQKYLRILMDGLMKHNMYIEEVSTWNIDNVILSSQLHDVGKIAISDNILCKPGKLTAEEYEEMKKHTAFGGEVIEKMQSQTSEHAFLEYAKTVALAHHEKWNGTGYPNGLKGEEIPLLGRLMSIVDVYDAIVSKRQYKEPMSHEEAIDEIVKGSGTQFEPALVELFCKVADKFKDI